MFTSFDNVHTSPRPELWNMFKCLAMAIALAGVGVGATVLMLVLAATNRANWWHLFDFELTIPASDMNPVPGKVVAVMYLCLTALIQLNLFATRNPSFWWRFGSKSAPRPSLVLLAPVVAFLLGATFIAVYWPSNIEPDQGRGAMEGAGWAAIGITWAYVIVWWILADLAKTIVSKVFRASEAASEECKRDGRPVPGWVRRLNAPAAWTEAASDKTAAVADAVWSKFARCFGLKERRTPLSREEMRSQMSNALSLSRSSGISVDELRAMSTSGIGRRSRRATARSRGTLPRGLGADVVTVDMTGGKAGDAGTGQEKKQ
jgi:hypothetical protein